MSSEHLLKVLSGNHQGAEVILGNESVVVGSGEDSDIVLTDSMIKEHHVKITFSDDGTVIQPLDGQVYIDGKLVKDEEQTATDFQFVTIGSTHIIFGPANEPWPNLSANDAPAIESSDEIKAPENSPTEQPETTEVAEDAIVQKSSIKNGHTKRTWIIGISTAFVFAFALSLLVFLSLFSDEKQINESPDINRLISNEIRSIGLTDTISVDYDGQTYTVSGYTDTNNELSTLRTSLPKISPAIKLRLYSEERITSEIQDLMVSIPSNPKISCVRPGVFVISGYVYDKEAWEKIRQRILDDIPGIVDIQDEVILPSKAANLAKPILTRYKLTGKVVVLPQEDSLVIGGLVASDEEENWKLAKIQLERTYGPDVPLQLFVKVSDPEVIKRQYFGSEIDSISICENGLNWIGFKNGTRYMEGATLANGYTIKSITPETITLTKNTQEVILKIGDIQ
ncbi:MAG: type III secretion system inner membrane ring subunit SctD [Opitutales bacterium]|nr:type III secretion system inner membrane ring subunit SctD [Opitutales bacterium]